MVANQHFQRLKHIYASDGSGPTGDQVSIAYGRAELEGTIDGVGSAVVGAEMPHHRLLSDAAALAAGSLEKERFVTAEQFSVEIAASDHEGPVVTSAEVVLAAEGRGVFRPGEDHLPPVPDSDPSAPHEADTVDTNDPDVNDPDADDPEAEATPPPATFMPVHTTPYGIVCLN